MEDAVKEGEIPVGTAEASEQEGQEEQGEQVQQGEIAVPDIPVTAVDPTASDSDPLSSLPLAILTPIQGQGTAEKKKEDDENQENENQENENQEEDEEVLEEVIEEQRARTEYDNRLGSFYMSRSRYIRGIYPLGYRMISQLLKKNKKVASKLETKDVTEGKGKNKTTEKKEVPIHGKYFIIVKDRKSSEDDEKRTILFFPESARYTSTGDMQNVDMKDDAPEDTAENEDSVIKIPDYRPLTSDELFANLDSPNKAISLAQETYNKAHAAMRMALKEEGHPNLKISMNLLEMADLQLLSARYAARAIYMEGDVPTNTLLFDRRNDTSKIESVGRFIGSKIPITKRYVTNTPPPAEQPLGSTANVIVINMPESENGILSPFFQIPITIEGTVYSCAYKAILSLLVSEVGAAKDTYIEEMVPIDSPYDLIEYDALIREGEDEKKIEGHLATLIAEVYTAALQQNRTMANTLKATGDALLVVVPQERPMDSFLGVGVDPNQTELIRNPTKWKGRNMYGKVLMDLRKTLPDVQVPQGVPVVIEQQQEVPEGSISLDEEIGNEEEDEVPELVIQEEDEN